MSSKRRVISRIARHMLPHLQATIKAIIRRPRPTSKHNNADALPPELLFAIFEHFGRDKKTIAVCTLVCRSWSAVASVSLCNFLSVSCWRRSATKRSSRFPPFAHAVIRDAPNRLSANLVTLYINVVSVDFVLLGKALACLTKLQTFTLTCETFSRARSTYRPPTETLEVERVHLSAASHKGPIPKRQTLTDILVLFRKIDNLMINGQSNRSFAGNSHLLQQFNKRNISVKRLEILASLPVNGVDPENVEELVLECRVPADRECLNATISSLGPNIRALTVTARQHADEEVKRFIAPPLALQGCAVTLRSVVLQFDYPALNGMLLDAWRMSLEEFSHPGVENLHIFIDLAQWFGGPNWDDATTSITLWNGIHDFLPWRMLDGVVERCKELKNINLALRISTISSEREPLHVPTIFIQLPPAIACQLTAHTRSKITFHAFVEDKSHKRKADPEPSTAAD